MTAPFAASVITLFPEAFPGVLGVSLIGKALRDRIWTLDVVQLRDFGIGGHNKVDDAPAGGGAGLVLRPDVAAAALDSIPASGRPLLYPSPRGRPLTQDMTQAWAKGPGLVIFCGRFEGLDQRVIEARGLTEVCVGDAVLVGGEVAAQLILEATVRLLPDVVGNERSLAEESFIGGLLEHPQYTLPRVWEDRETPAVLLSGDHAKVAAWRRAQAEKLTAERRPDLLAKPDRA
jgi:tRNA (guanine37-N1)-methyltransferase